MQRPAPSTMTHMKIVDGDSNTVTFNALKGETTLIQHETLCDSYAQLNDNHSEKLQSTLDYNQGQASNHKSLFYDKRENGVV